jgi:glyoxylate carboligase
VCLVTSGPGVTNAVTGIATAHMDSVPLVARCRPAISARTPFRNATRWELPGLV